MKEHVRFDRDLQLPDGWTDGDCRVEFDYDFRNDRIVARTRSKLGEGSWMTFSYYPADADFLLLAADPTYRSFIVAHHWDCLKAAYCPAMHITFRHHRTVYSYKWQTRKMRQQFRAWAGGRFWPHRRRRMAGK